MHKILRKSRFKTKQQQVNFIINHYWSLITSNTTTITVIPQAVKSYSKILSELNLQRFGINLINLININSHI